MACDSADGRPAISIATASLCTLISTKGTPTYCISGRLPVTFSVLRYDKIAGAAISGRCTAMSWPFSHSSSVQGLVPGPMRSNVRVSATRLSPSPGTACTLRRLLTVREEWDRGARGAKSGRSTNGDAPPHNSLPLDEILHCNNEAQRKPSATRAARQDYSAANLTTASTHQIELHRTRQNDGGLVV